MDNTVLYIANASFLENVSLFDKAYKLVSNQRQKKVDKFKFGKDKRLSLASELLLMFALKEQNISVNNLVFDYKENNKPYLPSLKNKIKFNISHSGEFVICAVSPDEVGCDIEKIKKYDLNVAKRFFNEKEFQNISLQATEAEKQDMFYRYWTLKESFVKALGQGLHLSLKDFQIIIDGQEISVEQKENSNSYYFKEYDIDNYKCAVCSCGKDFAQEIIKVDLEQFIN